MGPAQGVRVLYYYCTRLITFSSISPPRLLAYCNYAPLIQARQARQELYLVLFYCIPYLACLPPSSPSLPALLPCKL